MQGKVMYYGRVLMERDSLICVKPQRRGEI